MKTCVILVKVKDGDEEKLKMESWSLVPDDHPFGLINGKLHVEGSLEVVKPERGTE